MEHIIGPAIGVLLGAVLAAPAFALVRNTALQIVLAAILVSAGITVAKLLMGHIANIWAWTDLIPPAAGLLVAWLISTAVRRKMKDNQSIADGNRAV